MSLKNSKQFVDEAKSWEISPDEIQVSFDVVALYPSIPVKKAIDDLMNMLKTDEQDLKTLVSTKGYPAIIPPLH